LIDEEIIMKTPAKGAVNVPPAQDFVADAAVTTDLLQVLHHDHKTVQEMFFQFTQLEDDKAKKALVGEIIKELTIHAKAEEEIVYPAVRDAADEAEDLMDEADTEHHVVKFLMAELRDMSPKDDHFDSKVTVLCELVKHHVAEEEKEMFEKIKNSGLDLEELGKQVIDRKEVLAEKPLPEEKFPVTSSKRRQSK
jgi:hemerythrin superfamily protein